MAAASLQPIDFLARFKLAETACCHAYKWHSIKWAQELDDQKSEAFNPLALKLWLEANAPCN